MKRTPLVITNIIFLLLALVLPCVIVISRIPAGDLRNALLTLNWFVWFIFASTYPFAAVQSGVVASFYGTTTSRERSPVGFWTGLIALSLLWVTVLSLVSLFSYMAWYFGA